MSGRLTEENENPVCHSVCHPVCHPEFISGSQMMWGQEILKQVQNDRLSDRVDGRVDGREAVFSSETW